jgi:hypothetical protein
MAKRIGEALVEKGLINSQQLNRALKAQLIFGGHLGTNLIELGFIDEVDFVQVLGDLLHLRHATLDMLQAIPPSVIHSIPRALVEKYQIVPVKLEGKTLHVAVIDPKNVGPLSSRTGYKIVPCVAPEARVFEALQKYYGIPLRARYITICNELARQISRASRGASPRTRGNAQQGAEGEEPTLGSLCPDDDDDVGWEYQYGKSWREIAGEDDEGEEDLGSPRSSSEPRSLEEAAEHLCRADNADHLAEATLGYAQHHMAGSILFAVRSNTAHVWKSRGLDLSREKVKGLRFPVLAGSIFTLLLGNSYYRGAVPDTSSCRCFYGSLQIERPREVLLAPIYLYDQLAAIFYGHSGQDGGIEAETDDYLDLIEKLSMALNMLILKMKIRAV